MAAATRGGDDAPKQSRLLAAEATAIALKRVGADATAAAAAADSPTGVGAGDVIWLAVVEAVDAAEGAAGVSSAASVVAIVVKAEVAKAVLDDEDAEETPFMRSKMSFICCNHLHTPRHIRRETRSRRGEVRHSGHGELDLGDKNRVPKLKAPNTNCYKPPLSITNTRVT
ncbi:unnamed protein product [Miscanthus lutarioriparius]|uniref:Uncharacterized protein n=1 Tax=Miscanthus lutarioriparius TaxID=422564 RepID=A0A811S5P7_9POAL|nr:unnamed protein product [Miscanthus lutarioriparius]